MYSSIETLSINSPAIVIFRAPEGQSIQGFLELEGSIVQKPGSQSDRIVLLPLEWVVDGVEVFNGESASNKKRLNARVDASYITQSKTFEGHSLIRRVDEEKSSVRGYEVLADTNNSSNDFYESEKQSLRD